MIPVRTYLVDDNPEFLDAAIRFLSSDPQIEIVGSATSGQAALAQIPLIHPDLVLVDLAMPGINGLETTSRIKELTGAPRVILFTLHDNPEYRKASETVHADGFVPKSEFGVQLLPLVYSLFAYTPAER